MGKDLILTINPGTTTTRIGLFELKGETVSAVSGATIDHDEHVMARFKRVAEQLPYRAETLRKFVEVGRGDGRLVAVAGRGGMLTPVPAGVIAVTPALVDFALNRPVHQHASNLGAPLAHALAEAAGCPAFVVDPVSVDELPAVARVSGCPDIPRFSFVHALNIRECGRRLASHLGKPFAELNAVVAHLGAGISIAALQDGRIVDTTNRMETSPFSPERAGGLPPMPLIDLCYSGRFSKEELKRQLYGRGGVSAYLGTKDMRRVEVMIAEGDAKAKLVWEAMIYQIVKAIGAMAAALEFRHDGIVLTGGMVQSERLNATLEARISALGPVTSYPGSFESEALAAGAARVLTGCEMPRIWPVVSDAEALPW